VGCPYDLQRQQQGYGLFALQLRERNGHNAPPGQHLDGGGFGDDGKQKNYGANFMFSETTSSLIVTNEARFGFNYLHTGFQHPTRPT